MLSKINLIMSANQEIRVSAGGLHPALSEIVVGQTASFVQTIMGRHRGCAPYQVSPLSTIFRQALPSITLRPIYSLTPLHIAPKLALTFLKETLHSQTQRMEVSHTNSLLPISRLKPVAQRWSPAWSGAGLSAIKDVHLLPSPTSIRTGPSSVHLPVFPVASQEGNSGQGKPLSLVILVPVEQLISRLILSPTRIEEIEARQPRGEKGSKRSWIRGNQTRKGTSRNVARSLLPPPVERVFRRLSGEETELEAGSSLLDKQRLSVRPAESSLDSQQFQSTPQANEIDLKRLTDQVVQAIDYRIISQRERMGKV